MQKTYLYLMVCVIGAMSLASCSEDSISPDAGGDGDGDSTTEVPLAQVAKPKPNPWLAQEEYSITHFNSAQTDAFSSAVKDGTFNIDLSKCQMTWSGPVNLMTLASTSPNYMWGMSSDRVSYLDISDGKLERVAEAEELSHFRKKSVRSKPPFTLPQFFFPVWFVLGLNFLVLLRSFRLTMICACISLSLSPSRLKWIFA